MDDVAFWSNPATTGRTNPGLTDGEAIALYNVGIQPGLHYTVAEAEQLFLVHREGSGSVTIEDLAWEYAEGLSGADGELITAGGEYTLVLDGSAGTGVKASTFTATLFLIR
jgi:hypothetical protein